jgi:hypothetical protein
MRNGFFLGLVLGIVSLSSMAQNRFWVAAGAGNWNNTANWSTTSGGAGGASVPGAANTVVFNASGLGNCNLDIAPTVAGITVSGYTGTIDLLGFNLTTTGTNTFTSGTINNTGAAAAVTLNSTGTTTFNGTTFGADVNGSSASILFNGSVFNGTVSVTKTNNTTDTGTGGNTFNSTITLTNLGTAEFRLGNTNPDIFNGTVTTNVNNTGLISLARTGAGTQFNGDLILNYNAAGDVAIGANGGTSTLANTRAITVNCTGGCDDLTLSGLTQVGTTPQTINLSGSGTSRLSFGPNSSFAGPLTITAEELFFRTTTFTNTCVFTQTGTTSMDMRGGNTFATVTFNSSGSGDLHFGTNAADAGDIFTGDATFNITGGGRVRVGSYTTGNLFQGNLTVTNTSAVDVNSRFQLSRFNGSSSTVNGTATFNNFGNASDVHICFEAGSTAVFNGEVIINQNTTNGGTAHYGANGNVTYNGNISVTNTSGNDIEFSDGTGLVTFGNGNFTVNTFNAGTLRFQNFTQTGATPISITLGGTAVLTLGPASTFNGNVTFSSPQVNLNGTTYNGNADITKTGATNNAGTGGNTFNGTTSITLTGSGYLLTGNTGADIFNGPTTLTNTGTNILYLAQNGAGHQFNNNIIFNCTSTSGIRFCQGTGSVTLTNGSMSIGGTGFSAGDLRLTKFTQAGAGFPQSLTLTGTSALYLGASSSFDGAVTFSAPRVFLNGATYNNTAFLTKTGGSDDSGSGGNVFNNTTTLTNSGSGYLLSANSSIDIFNGDLTLTNTGSSYIYMAYNTVGNQFNGNVVVNNTGSALGILFCASGVGTATLADTRTITVGGGGFSTGELRLPRFTQVGGTAQSLTLTSTALLRIGPASQFNGDVTFASPRLLLDGCTYNGSASLQKTGALNDQAAGNNTFNGVTSITNSGSGVLRTNGNNTFNGTTTITNSGSQDILLELSTGSTYNGDVTFNNTGSSYIRVAYLGATTFNGNISVSNLTGFGVYFCESGTATATLADTRTITIGGGGFNAGELRLPRFTQVGGTAQALTLTGTGLLTLGPSSTFNGNVDFTSPRILLNGTTYNGTSRLKKTGSISDNSSGGNIFNQNVSIINSGSDYLLTGGTLPDTFNSLLTIENLGSSTVRLADNSPGNQFNGNIELNSTFGGGIYFGNNANGTSTLAAGRTIAVGTSGVISGDIRLIRFTQVGPTAQTLDLSGIAILTLGPSSSFGGDVNFRAPQLLLNGTTFSLSAYLEKEGATDNAGAGGNTFNGTTTLVNSGSGYLMTANTTADTFNGTLTVTNTGSNIIYLAHASAGNQFNGNITFNSTLGSGGVYFSNNAAGSATLGNGASMSVGGLGFVSGQLRFIRFTQIGSAAQTLTLSGTALMQIGPSSTFNGDVDFRAPQLALNGCTYNGLTYIEKTGATNNNSNGGNVFNGTTTIANSGSGIFYFAISSLDTFNSDLTITNSGSASIRMADVVAGSLFNGNIVVNCTAGTGIFFGDNPPANATLASGRTITAGTFTIGELRLDRFTQLGGTPQNILLTGTALLKVGPGTVFNGDADFRAPQMALSGGTFNGTAFIEKTGASNNTGTGSNTFNSTTTLRSSGSGNFRTNGGNTFNGTTSFTNAGTGDMLFELTTASTYNGDITLTNSNTSYIRMAYQGASAFNGNIIVNNSAGIGIYFSEVAGGSSTLASGRTLSIGTGFSAGELRLARFTQLGSSAQSLSLTGTSTFRTGPASTWNGDLTVSAPSLFLDGATLSGTTNAFTKTGSSTDSSVGNNIFSGNTTFTNSGAGIFRLGVTTADTYNGTATFVRTNGTIQPAYNNANIVNGSFSTNSTTAITFGANNGSLVFSGGNAQTISKVAGASPVVTRLTMNKTSNTLTLNTDVTVSLTASFTSGVLNTDAVNYLNVADNATVTGGVDASYVDGPVRKTGNDAFTFPVGDDGFYRPISISAPGNTAHYFVAQYINANHNLGGPANWDPTFYTVSGCEYWTLDRNPGPSSNVFVTLSWNESACNPGYITDPVDLRVTRWDGTNWVNHGNGGTTGTATNGTIITSALVTSFSPFTLASTSSFNPLPVELAWFRGSLTAEDLVLLEWQTTSELNNESFQVQRSADGFDFTTIHSLPGKGTTTETQTYTHLDKQPLPGVSYYRLKQKDFDGSFSYSSVVSITRGDGAFSIYPNPAGKEWVSFNRKATVEILNNLNQSVQNYTEANGFYAGNLPAGVYVVRTSQGEVVRLVVK